MASILSSRSGSGCGGSGESKTHSGAPAAVKAGVKDAATTAKNRKKNDRPAGQLFTWGRGSHGQLGQDAYRHPRENCALPHPVPGLVSVVQVACGGGQQGCTGAVDAHGQLFTWGNNYGGRLGLGDTDNRASPERVTRLPGPVTAVAFGTSHGACVMVSGACMTWGANRRGCLGRTAMAMGERTDDSGGALVPGPVMPLESDGGDRAVAAAAAKWTALDAEHHYTAAITSTGALWIWGANEHGKLGLGDTRDRSAPVRVRLTDGEEEEPAVALVRCGSIYCAAVTTSGHLYMWGWGGHGNLGLGKRVKSKRRPQRVVLGGLGDRRVVDVGCTRGQPAFKGGMGAVKGGGSEGPHTLIVTADGELFTCGTCHKGLGLNLGNKTGAFGQPWDELSPYHVGVDPVRNAQDKAPMAPHGPNRPMLCVWPPPYDVVKPFVGCVSAHIHSAVVDAEGRAWAWGCGSNDGRAGVERFLNMAGEGKPPKVDAMKCYMMNPHRIGLARRKYWGGGESLREMRVLQLATGRNHMACIAVPRQENRKKTTK